MNPILDHPSRRAALGMIGATLILAKPAFAEGLETLSGTAFGTGWRISAPPGNGLAKLAPAIDALFARIDQQASPWRGDSLISQFNFGPAGVPTTDPGLFEVTAAALEIARQSAGAFDPTVGPLVARRGFGPIRDGGAPDWRGLSVGQGQVIKARDDLTLDLCGIAKGWALDAAVALALDAGVQDVLFELGGEFAAFGQHPSRRDWRVGVEPLHASMPARVALRLPSGAAVATSGTGVQSYTVNGTVYSHIISADGADAGLRSVTVLAEKAMIADGWATALCAAGHTDGPALAEANDVAALFLFDRRGEVELVQTAKIAEYVL